jgi:hypothetical protein
MLSVGREINIENKDLLCRNCAWQGRAAELSTGLLRVNHTDIYLYAYRCPECESFDLASKGKVLVFRSRSAITVSESFAQGLDDRQNLDSGRRK